MGPGAQATSKLLGGGLATAGSPCFYSCATDTCFVLQQQYLPDYLQKHSQYSYRTINHLWQTYSSSSFCMLSVNYFGNSTCLLCFSCFFSLLLFVKLQNRKYLLASGHIYYDNMRSKTKKNIWAATWQNQQNECAPSEDSDQPGHPPSLISLRHPHEESLGPELSIERTAKTDQTGWMADAQADLSLHWAHRSFCWFCHVVAHFFCNHSG